MIYNQFKVVAVSFLFTDKLLQKKDQQLLSQAINLI